jgi:amino acid adenylation domain-containing protein/thioester reductase-like protein
MPGRRRIPRLAPVPRPEVVPLSLTQQRLWLLDQVQGESVAYNNIFALRLRGPLDEDAWAAALTVISDRHEALRTRFPTVDGEPRQVVTPPGPLRVRREDLAGLAPDERENEARRIVAEEQLRPHDLATAPPVRYLLIRIAPDDHISAVAMHHIVCDAGSFDVIRRELGRYYPVLAAGGVVEDEPSALQYADYALWQRDLAASGRLDTQLAYWRRALHDAPATSTIMTGRRPDRHDGRTETGASHDFSVEPALTDRLQRLSRDATATLFMTLFAAFGLLLSWQRPDRRGDVVVGVPFDGRSDRRLTDLVGMFVNTLAVRVRCAPELTFRALSREVRDTLLESYGNSDVPFDRVVRELAPSRDTRWNPIFQVMFQLQHATGDGDTLDGLDVTTYPPAPQPAKFDLTVNVVLADGRLTGDITYAATSFEEEAIARLAEDYQALLAAVAADPDRPVGTLAPHTTPAPTVPVSLAPGQPAAPVRRAPNTALEALLLGIFTEVLGTGAVGVHDSFFDLGGHSLLAIKLMRRVNAETATRTPINAIFRRPSVAELAELLSGRENRATAGALSDLGFVADAQLDPAITAGPVGTPVRTPPRQVLLTGATGLLGAHVLHETLLRSDATVACLVRATDEAAAMARLRDALTHHQLWDEALAWRIVPVCGDLARPLLGLDAAAFERLAEDVDAIYHVGARTNLLDGYDRVRPTNVAGTHEILRLASRRPGTAVHHVSTISTVVGGPADPEVLPADWSADPELLVPNGYLRSKWVAEQLVRLAGERGVPTAVYRPGRLCGDSRTGAMTGNDAFWHYVRACVELRAMPDAGGWLDAEVDLVPVDFVAAAFVRLAFTAEPAGQAYNLTNPTTTTLRTVLAHLRRLGYPLREVPHLHWLELLGTAAVRRPPTDTTSLHSVSLLNSVGDAPNPAAAPRKVSRANVERDLAGTGVVCPAIDTQVLDRYLAFFTAAGFLSPAGDGPPETSAGGSSSDNGAPAGAKPVLSRGVGRPLEQVPADFLTRFDVAAGRTPSAIAVRDGSATRTFAELAGDAHAVAARLWERGIGTGARVAIHLDHGAALVAVVIGVMRAGATFVPVDPRHTDARTARILHDSKADLLVHGERPVPAGGPPRIPAADLLAESGDGAALPPTGRGAFPPTDPEASAYVLFTSGSTGEPKGVVVPHRALAAYLDWATTRYLCRGPHGAPLFTSIAFDLTLTSALAPLCHGRTVHAVSVDRGVSGVADLLADGESFGFVKLTPGHLRVLLAELESRPARGRVSCLVVGGEQLPGDLVRAWHDVQPETVVVNEYGPTETTIGCCAYEIGPGEAGVAPARVPIGRPIPGVVLRVLDERGDPVPDGEPGELYVGGTCLADGYLDRPDLTAARFVADPVTGGAAALYRTGDLVRHLPGGDLVYLGRADGQLKVRGHRIEPAEVESAIRAAAGVRDSAVTAWVRAEDDVRLVAHVVVEPGADWTEIRTGIAETLADRLPPHLIPDHVQPVDRIPLDRNGKVDRRRLPEPASVHSGAELGGDLLR